MAMSCGSKTRAPRLIATLISAALVATTIEPAHAANSAAWLEQHDTARPNEFASMLRLRIPFGGGAGMDARPSLALWMGPSAPMAHELPRVAFTPTLPSLEAGFTFDGSALLRLGAFDILAFGRQLRANAAGTNAADTNAGNTGDSGWLLVLGAVAVVGGLALVSAAVSNGSSSGG